MQQPYFATPTFYCHKVQTSELLSNVKSAQKAISQYDGLLLRCESNSGGLQHVKKLLCMLFSQKHSNCLLIVILDAITTFYICFSPLLFTILFQLLDFRHSACQSDIIHSRFLFSQEQLQVVICHTAEVEIYIDFTGELCLKGKPKWKPLSQYGLTLS